MNAAELGEEYRAKSDAELLRLALSPEQLTADATLALTSELARRHIGDEAHLSAARKEESERKADIGTLTFIPSFGLGRMRFGRADRVLDPETGLERFKTTVFIVLFCFPFIPTGTYVVERQPALPDKLTSLERLPLDWEQVLRVWAVAAGSILGFIWFLTLLTSSDLVRDFVRDHWR